MALVTALTWALPHRLLSSLARRLAYSRSPRISRWLIDTVVRRFDVDLSEAANSDPRAYESFNAFFTRALRPGVRVPDPDPAALLMPADGRISQCGRIGDVDDAGRIFQAKGQSFTAAELLGDGAAARAYEGGAFATVYLSPRDYHRVRMPWAGILRETVHVPGRLFSVGPAAVRHVPRLLADGGVDGRRAAGVRGGNRVGLRRDPGLWQARYPQGLPRPRHRARALRRDGALQLRLDRDRPAAARRGGTRPRPGPGIPGP